uniref:(California timema) hypothetical protein n=1 Tax=Timema californicum TaxID=61474 RepID=A0A7R9P3E7_TIMCA|nr:unnamed protein product [Timema californicum]
METLRIVKEILIQLRDKAGYHLHHNTGREVKEIGTRETKIVVHGSTTDSIGKMITIKDRRDTISIITHQGTDNKETQNTNQGQIYNLKSLHFVSTILGEVHDQFIFRYGSLRQALERLYHDGIRNTWLLGKTCSSDHMVKGVNTMLEKTANQRGIGFRIPEVYGICVNEEWKSNLDKTIFSTPTLDSNINVHDTSSLAYYKSSTLDHVATEIFHFETATKENEKEWGGVVVGEGKYMERRCQDRQYLES